MTKHSTVKPQYPVNARVTARTVQSWSCSFHKARTLSHCSLPSVAVILNVYVIKYVVLMPFMSISSVYRFMAYGPTADKSTLFQVMVWCPQATSHYLSQCWRSSNDMESLDQNDLKKCFPTVVKYKLRLTDIQLSHALNSCFKYFVELNVMMLCYERSSYKLPRLPKTT